MAKLATLSTSLATLRAPLGAAETQSRTSVRIAEKPWRAWYGTTRWKKLRLEILVRDEFTCKLCGTLEPDTSQLVCDHVRPHRGDESLFWAGPFQTLCKLCHDVIKQAEEKGGTASFYPSFLRTPLVPVTMVCGPPASGKSTYVARNARRFDMVIDLDQIVSRLTGQFTHNWRREDWLVPAIRARNAMLLHLSARPRFKAAWFIATEPKAERRQWWTTKLGCSVIVLKPTEAECLARARIDADRDQAHTGRAIVEWFNSYQPMQNETVIQ